MGEHRLFVGNLPNDISESNIKELFNNYKVSKVEIKRKKALDEESVFAFVNISSNKTEKCLNELRNKKWKDCNLKVELARESFLDRLKKEHSEKKKPSTVNFDSRSSKNQFQLRQNSDGVKNKKIIFDSDNEAEEPNSINTVNSSPEDVPRKRNLPMFRGTTSIVTENKKSGSNGLKTNSNIVSYSDIKSSANEANSAMRKFEEFSDVWKDEPVRITNKEYKKITFKTRVNLHENKDECNDDVQKNEPECNLNGNKKITFKTRVNLHKDKDECNDDVRKNEPECKLNDNKKINFKSKFNPDDKQKSIKWKKSATNENSSDINASTNNEELDSRNSTIPDDDRFKLNEKFFDSDDAPSLDRKQNRNLSQSLENKLQKSSVAKNVFEHRQLVRYDPMRPEHKILEKKTLNTSASQSTIIKEKKLKLKKKSEKQKHEMNEKLAPVKPEVSKEKHYSVADSLRNAFKNTENQGGFSLSALFDQQIKKDDSSLSTQHKDVAKPFDSSTIKNVAGQSSESESEEDVDEEPAEILPTPASEKILGKCGVWGETFFFKKDDSRFIEAIDFFKPEDKKNVTDFDKQRCKLRSIVRKKLQNSKKDNKLFRQKLGGKLNKSKFKMRLKKAREY